MEALPNKGAHMLLRVVFLAADAAKAPVVVFVLAFLAPFTWPLKISVISTSEE